MRDLSIRLRLTLWYTAVLLLGLALFATGMWIALQQRLVSGVDSRLSQRVEGLRTVLRLEKDVTGREQLREELSEFIQAIPEGSSIALRDSQGALLGPAASIETGSPGPRPQRVLNTSIEQGGETYYVTIAAPLDEVTSVMRDFRTLLLFMIPAVLALACAGGYWISGRALTPVDEITRVARSISVRNLSKRLPVPRSRDEIERMSRAWNEVLERLESSVERIRQFTADASHELRTPLALIRGTAELALRRERTADEYRKSLADIHDEAGRMTDLTESLLSLARAGEPGALPLERTDLGRLVRDVVEHSKPAASARSVGLEAGIPDSPAIVAANGPAIRRLLLTLIDNALKHTPGGGRVIVSATPNGAGVVLAVEDNGEGIPPEAVPHIFQRFFRADSSRTDRSGVGLGLSIAQAIAHAHGSRVSVDSRPGEGSRFELLLRA